MTITADQLTAHYPRLYHMAEKGIWRSIEKHGLLSTSALLDLFEISGDFRRRIETEHRPRSVTITHPIYGSATIRDQKPMREGPLRKCLQGMTIKQWYLMLNGRVFFWVTEDRVQTLLNAKAYRDHTHTVLTVETRSLLKKYAGAIALSPINSGSTIYNPRPRGAETFRSLTEYPFEERRRLRGVANAIAELSVSYSVPDIRELVIRVEHRKGGRILETLYSRTQKPLTSRP